MLIIAVKRDPGVVAGPEAEFVDPEMWDRSLPPPSDLPSLVNHHQINTLFSVASCCFHSLFVSGGLPGTLARKVR